MKKDKAYRHRIRLPWMLFGAVVLLAGAASGEAMEYSLDPTHSRIGFEVGHLGISTIAGQFTNYTGHIEYDAEQADDLEMQINIDAGSIFTGSSARDGHLRGADFFHVAEYGDIRFVSDTVQKKGDTWHFEGDFTMHGVTQRITLPVTIAGPIEDPWGKQRIGLRAETTINRQEYGVGSKKPADELIGDEVTVRIRAEAAASSSD